MTISNGLVSVKLLWKIGCLLREILFWSGEKNIEICCLRVEKTQKAVKDIGSSVFVNTDDLLSNKENVGNNDEMHLSREVLETE